MKTAYRSYRADYSEQDLAEKELTMTAADVSRPSCPVCRTDTYVTPVGYGMPEPQMPIEEVALDKLEVSRVTYTCIFEDYAWDCDRCSIRF